MSDLELETRVAAALRREDTGDEDAIARIMARVRDAARDEGPPAHGRPMTGSRDVPAWRGERHSLVGVALAAGVGSIMTLSTLIPPGRAGSGVPGASVIGDTVVALHDTLRLVRVILEDAGARRVAVVGDFEGGESGGVPLARDADHRWSATLAMADGTHRYAFVVDGERWVADPAAARVRGDGGRVYSVLRVAPGGN